MVQIDVLYIVHIAYTHIFYNEIQKIQGKDLQRDGERRSERERECTRSFERHEIEFQTLQLFACFN